MDALIEDRTAERLARRLSNSIALEKVSSDALDRVRQVTRSGQIEQELIARALRRSEQEFARVAECLENIGARMGRQRARLAKLEGGV